MEIETSKRNILFSKLEGIENFNYDGLSDYESFYLLSELKRNRNPRNAYSYQ